MRGSSSYGRRSLRAHPRDGLFCDGWHRSAAFKDKPSGDLPPPAGRPAGVRRCLGKLCPPGVASRDETTSCVADWDEPKIGGGSGHPRRPVLRSFMAKARLIGVPGVWPMGP